MEFIVGKWYKNPGNFQGSELTWAKFEKWERGRFYFTECITNGIYENKKTYWSYHSANTVYESTDIKEIQQYLPENHPDKLENIKIIDKDYKYLIKLFKKLKIK